MTRYKTRVRSLCDALRNMDARNSASLLFIDTEFAGDCLNEMTIHTSAGHCLLETCVQQYEPYRYMDERHDPYER